MRILPSLAAAALVVASTTSQATIINTFTTRAAFDLAVGATSAENFNSFVVETPFHSVPLDVGPFTISMTGTPSTSSTRNRIDLPPPAFDVDQLQQALADHVLAHTSITGTYSLNPDVARQQNP